jgi:hypothetical protein
VSARALAQHIGNVADALYWSLAFVKIKLTPIAAMDVVAGEPTHDAEELIVAAPQRAIAREVSQMPFADQRSTVADAT